MLALLIRIAVRRGVLGGSRPWLVVGMVAGGVRLLRKLARKDEEVVHRQEIRPGDTVVIEHQHTTWGEVRGHR